MYAHYEGADQLPRVPTALWWRLVTVLQARGERLHPSAARMATHLTHHADAAGCLSDIPAVLESYAVHHSFASRASGKRVGWTDLMRLREIGLVRQVCGAAPGRQARYVLSMDLAALPDDLPADLKAELLRHIDNPIAAAKGQQTRASIDANLSECEMVREGSATRPRAITTAAGCGRLHTSPYTREGLSPSHPARQSQPSRRPRQLPFRGKDRIEERAHAVEFVLSLQPRWARQRDGQILTDREVAEVSYLAVLLLRHMPESEAAELLCEQVSSATDLAGVLRWRIGRVLGRARRAARNLANLATVLDEDGSAHAAWLAANAERNAANAPRRAALVDQARRRAQELRDRGHHDGPARRRPSEASRPERREAPVVTGGTPEVLGAQIAAQGPAQPPSPMLAEPEEIFRREVLDRHALPVSAPTRWASEPEPEHLPDIDFAAERARLVELMAARQRREETPTP
ncbi:hypothetical protein [Streptosporangium sp. NPDC000509]|uniref:hypothetical protein n=1 Tax=Streptosporangium sp. NPDC000509 TaxID=3366186 RepID=UPI0036C0B40D